MVKKELDILEYRKVSQPLRPGEYSASSTKIELIRRPFEFPNDPEPDRHVMLYFNAHQLEKIESRGTNQLLDILKKKTES